MKKFAYFAHSEMSLRCLEGMIKGSRIPELCVISIKDGTHEEFVSEVKVICDVNGIRLVNVCDSCGWSEIETVKSLDELVPWLSECEFAISVGFMKILPEKVFLSPKLGTLNLHCGKLPKYRGRAPISRAIMEGDNNITVTVHMMDKGMDSGDIIDETKLPLGDHDDVSTMYEKCSEVSYVCALRAVKKLTSGKAKPQKQTSDVPANDKISDDERKILWSDDARKIFNKIRAITFPYPGAKTKYKGKEYIVLHSELMKTAGKSAGAPGEIEEVLDRSLKVSTGDAPIIIKDMFCNGNFVKNHKKIFAKGGKFS